MEKPKHKAKKHYMALEEVQEFLDAWAREQNEVARHKQRVSTCESLEHAERAGIDWRAAHGLEAARKLRNEDAAEGRKVRAGRVRAKQRLKERCKKRETVLLPLVKEWGLKYPTDFFRGEKFRRVKACDKVLADGLPEQVRELFDKEQISRRMLMIHSKALATWTRTDRDREEALLEGDPGVLLY